MREVASRVKDALAFRPFAVFFGLLVLAGCALTGLPLLGLPGYELAAGLSLLHGLLGGVVGIAFGRRESVCAPLAIAAATACLWAALVPPFLLATLRTWLFSPCDPFATVGFFPLLTLPSGFLAASAGVLMGTVTKRWWTAALLWIGLVVLSAVHTLWPIAFGPQVFAYNHLAGFLPGPLYDEELRVPASLAWFRLGSIGLGLAFVALARGRPALFVTALALFAVVEWNGVALGFRMNDETLAERLGGLWENEQLELHYPAGLPKAEVDRIIEDVRFRHRQLNDFFGALPPGKVRVWWYRSSAKKQALVGADRTQFAKPWRREVHVNALGFPHPVLKHEFAHALAGPWGAPPFGATARVFGLVPNVGVIEGFAVAADNRADELTLHEWTAAMKKRGLLPDVRTLLGLRGFYSAPASRAYTTAGSFIRWLADTKGKDKLRELYRHGDFQEVYGQPLPALADEWEAFLDTVKVDARGENLAFARFRAGSLFDRPCAREVARLLAQASAQSGSDPPRALLLVSRCRALQPDEPSHVLAEARQLQRLGRAQQAAALLDGQLERFKDEPSLFADAALPRVQLALEADDEVTARRLLTTLTELQVSPAALRTARVRLATLELPPKGRAAAAAYFADGDDATRLYLLREGLLETPDQPYLAYLLGRRLTQAGESSEGLRWLEVALAAPLPEPLAEETTRLALEAAYGAHQCARVEALAHDSHFGSAFAARALDWLERCRFDRDQVR
ncbi:MAG: hypothetical protein IT380_00670 [Myxococcales bacterium]|nr:hypothetical protein [Myxococcales bacterium]